MKVAIYNNGVFQGFGRYPRADLSEPVTTSDGTDYRIEREGERPEVGEEQRLVTSIIHDDGPDAEYPHLKVRRVVYEVLDFTLEDVRAFRLSRLQARYELEQARTAGVVDAAAIDFRIAVLPVVSLVDRTSLTAGQRNRFADEVAKATKLQTNKANALALRTQLEQAATIAAARAVDLTAGWAA